MKWAHLLEWLGVSVIYTLMTCMAIGFFVAIAIAIADAPILGMVFGSAVLLFLAIMATRLLFTAINRAFGGRSEHPWPWE